MLLGEPLKNTPQTVVYCENRRHWQHSIRANLDSIRKSNVVALLRLCLLLLWLLIVASRRFVVDSWWSPKIG